MKARSKLVGVGEVNRHGRAYAEEHLRRIAEETTNLVYDEEEKALFGLFDINNMDNETRTGLIGIKMRLDSYANENPMRDAFKRN